LLFLFLWFVVEKLKATQSRLLDFDLEGNEYCATKIRILIAALYLSRLSPLRFLSLSLPQLLSQCQLQAVLWHIRVPMPELNIRASVSIRNVNDIYAQGGSQIISRRRLTVNELQ
jgi:hypothetical protein